MAEGRLIDSSAWIEFLRRGGDSKVRGDVETVLMGHQAFICPMVYLELVRGTGEHSSRALSLIRDQVSWLDHGLQVWSRAYSLAARLRKLGRPVPNTDILIFATAREHQIKLVHCDAHFEVLAGL